MPRTKQHTATVDPPVVVTPLMTAEEISPLVGLAASTILRKVTEGEFPCQRVGAKRLKRFSDEDVIKIRAKLVTPEQAISDIQPKAARA